MFAGLCGGDMPAIDLPMGSPKILLHASGMIRNCNYSTSIWN
jgi:hypothetical protein